MAAYRSIDDDDEEEEEPQGSRCPQAYNLKGTTQKEKGMGKEDKNRRGKKAYIYKVLRMERIQEEKELMTWPCFPSLPLM